MKPLPSFSISIIFQDNQIINKGECFYIEEYTLINSRTIRNEKNLYFVTAKEMIYPGNNNQLMVKSFGEMLKNLMIKNQVTSSEPALIVYVTENRTNIM